MAKKFTPVDASAVLNAVALQVLGDEASQIDLTDRVSVGEKISNAGLENVLSALSLVLGKTMVSVKPYTAKFALIQSEDAGEFSNIAREIIFFDKFAKEAGDVNTDVHKLNFVDGADNTATGSSVNSSVGTMWEKDLPLVAEIWFGDTEAWDFCMTMDLKQLKTAFRSDAEFAEFLNGVVIQKQNEINLAKENFNRKTVLNYIAGLYYLGTTPQTVGDTDYFMPGSAINLTAAYNAKFGTSYTSAQLRTTYLKDFLAFLVAIVKKTSNYMAEPSTEYQLDLYKTDGGGNVHPHVEACAKEQQALMLIQDIMIDAEATVLPEIFNDEYLKIENYEPIGFWQSRTDREEVNVKANIPTVSSGAISSTQTTAEVAIDSVIGVLFDKDAVKTTFQFESADTTPLEARKQYTNTWYHNHRGSINNFVRKGCVFYMADPVTPDPDDNGGEDGGDGVQ